MTATTIDTVMPGTAGAAPRRWQRTRTDELVLSMLTILFCMYATRDAMTGSLRYLLGHLHMAGIWFVPDLLSFVALGYFTWTFAVRRQSAWAVLLTIMVFASTIIGWLFMSSSSFALISSLKLFSPIYVGFCFAGRDLVKANWARNYIYLLVVASTIGLILSPYIDYPWVGMTIESFGQTRSVGRVWWAGGAMRYGGLAGDSTMAAYMCLFPLILIHRRLPKAVFLATGVAVLYALQVSTSKTAMGCAILFGAYYLAFEVFRLGRENLDLQRTIAKCSFALIAIPFALMILLGGVDLTKIDPMLFSMQDRINNTWVFPFVYLAQNFPVGLITGCGLGCFSYPMSYTYLKEFLVPVDNFYVVTYIMMGMPFVIFVVGMFTATLKTVDRPKLALMAIINVYVVTVQCYGPSTATIMIGYAFSDMFLPRLREWHRKQRTRGAKAAVPAMQTS